MAAALEPSPASSRPAPPERPWISANLALSADGKIASGPNSPSGWSSPRDHDRLRELRRPADALMVGHGTLRSDRMTLLCRNPLSGKAPLRCVVSEQGNFDPQHPLFQRPGGDIHLLVTGSHPPREIPGTTLHRTDLPGFLRELRQEFSVQHLHCEGGGQLIHALATLDVLDELHLTYCGHLLFGGQSAPTATGIPGPWLPASRAMKLSSFEADPDTGECYLSYARQSPSAAS